MAFRWWRGGFPKFPYTNFHEANLDYFLSIFSEIWREWEDLYTTLTEWKNDTDVDIQTWKDGVSDAIAAWELDFQNTMDVWKVQTGIDISSWESGVISDLNEWKEQFITAYESLAESVGDIVDPVIDMVENLAEPFLTTKNYNKFDYAIYDGELYKFTVNHSAGAWNADEVVKITLSDSVKNINKSLDYADLENYAIKTQFYAVAAGWTKYGANVNSLGYYIIPVTPGDEIYLKAHATNQSTVAFFSDYITPVVGDIPPYTMANTGISAGTENWFIVPDNTKYLYIHRGTAATVRIPQVIIINGYVLTDSLTKNIEHEKNPVKLKLMQFNVGRYNFGDGSDPGIRTADYTEKLTNYKKMFCKYSPDFIGLEECIPYINQNQNVLANTVLYNKIYPVETYYNPSGMNVQRCVKSKFPVIYQETGDITGTLSNHAYYSYTKILFHGKIISILCTALTSGAGSNEMAKRADSLPLILNKMRKDKYAFIILDANNSGNGAGVHSWDELATMVSTLHSEGWAACNGDYLPYVSTCISRLDPAVRPPIDNIFYKNNGNVVFDNFTALEDEYTNLTSDHFPCVGEFTLI